MNFRKKCLQIWKLFDHIYFHLTRLQYIKNKNGDKTIFRVRLIKYRGENIILADGTHIKKNDVLVKIHLHNVKILHQLYFYNDVKKVLILYRTIRESLPYVCQYLQLQKDTVKGVIGITMIFKGCEKLGFEPFPIENQHYKLFKRAALFPI